MIVRLHSFNGDADGLRWGMGARLNESGNHAAFRWSYDMLGDRLRLWKMDRLHSKDEEFQDPALASRARVEVRAYIAMQARCRLREGAAA